MAGLLNPIESASHRQPVPDVLPAKIALVDARGRVVALNAAWEERTPGPGCTHTLGDPDSETCPFGLQRDHPLASSCHQALARVLQNELPEVELGSRCPLLPEHWCSFRIARLPGTQGGALIVHRDILDRRASREECIGLLGTGVEGFAVLDPRTGRFLDVNPAYRKLSGFPRDELLQMQFADVMGDITPEQTLQLLATIRAQGRAVLPGRLRRKDDTLLEVLVSASYSVPWVGVATVCAADRTAGLQAIASGQRRGAARAVAAPRRRLFTDVGAVTAEGDPQALLGGVAGGVVHSLNNVFAGIISLAEILASQDLPASAREFVATIQTSGKDGAHILKRLREFARSRPASPLGPCALGPIVTGAINMTRQRWEIDARRQGVIITPHVAIPALPEVVGSPPEIREAIINLILNAVDAMPRGGTLSLQATAEAETVTLRVADTGTGMPEAIRGRIFEPFFSTKGRKGVGLGLPLVHDIMRRHGGSVDVASALGVGTTIRLRFRRARNEAPASRARPRGAAVGRTRHYLVLDPSPEIRGTLARLLQGVGHHVLEAESTATALKLLATTPVDLVLANFRFSNPDDWAVTQAIKARHPALRIVVLSLHTDPADPLPVRGIAIDPVLRARPPRRAAPPRAWADRDRPGASADPHLRFP